MASTTTEIDRTISMRMRFALVADKVQEADEAGDEEAADRLLAHRCDDHEITEHLARQMGIDFFARESDLHGTLLFVAEELDQRFRGKQAMGPDALAAEALSGLTGTEVLATVMAGRKVWKRHKVRACTVGTLDAELRHTLESALASSIEVVQELWRRHDTDGFHERREGAKARERQRQIEWEEHLYRQANPPPVSEATQREQDAAARRIRRRGPANYGYTPPGRT